jgi:hypothetical protein
MDAMFCSRDFNNQGNFIMFRNLRQVALSAALISVGFVFESGIENAFSTSPLNTGVESQSNELIPIEHIQQRSSGQSTDWQIRRYGNRHVQ